LKDIPKLWNVQHSDIFEVYGFHDVLESARRMISAFEEYKKRQGEDVK